MCVCVYVCMYMCVCVYVCVFRVTYAFFFYLTVYFVRCGHVLSEIKISYLNLYLIKIISLTFSLPLPRFAADPDKTVDANSH